MIDKDVFPWKEVQDTKRFNLLRWTHELTGVELKIVNGSINEELVMEVVEKLMHIIFSAPDNTEIPNGNSGKNTSR
jgi:hypothetical protein